MGLQLRERLELRCVGLDGHTPEIVKMHGDREGWLVASVADREVGLIAGQAGHCVGPPNVLMTLASVARSAASIRWVRRRTS